MKLNCLRGLKDPVVIEGITQVTVFDDEGQAIALVHSPTPGTYVLVDISSPDFYRLLNEYKVNIEKKPKVINA